MVFDKEDERNVDSWIKEIRKARKEVKRTNFSDIADYCVARREETIKLFLEMAEFLENNIDVFYDSGWKWVQSSKCRDALMNINNPILGYSRKSDFIHLWIPGGIKFLLRLSDGRVLWITHERNPSYNIKGETNADMEKWHYNFFDFWDAGQYPGFGYEKYVKTPAYENYFGNRPETPQGYFNLKKKVDEDWENAKVCRTCIWEAIATIHTCDKELLSQIKNVKADIRITRKDEGF